MVHVEGYSEFAAMTAIEIGHPKMDVGTSRVEALTVQDHIALGKAPMNLVSHLRH